MNIEPIVYPEFSIWIILLFIIGMILGLGVMFLGFANKSKNISTFIACLGIVFIIGAFVVPLTLVNEYHENSNKSERAAVETLKNDINETYGLRLSYTQARDLASYDQGFNNVFLYVEKNNKDSVKTFGTTSLAIIENDQKIVKNISLMKFDNEFIVVDSGTENISELPRK